MSDELNDALSNFSINYPSRPKYPSRPGLRKPEAGPSHSDESAFPNEDVLQGFADLSMTDDSDAQRAGEGSARSADQFSGGRTPTYAPGPEDELSRGFGDLTMTDNFTAEPDETEEFLEWAAGDMRASTPPPFSHEYTASHNDYPDPEVSAVTRSSTLNTDISEEDTAMKLDESLVKAMAHMHRRKSVSTKFSRTPIGKDGQGSGKGKGKAEGEGSARGRERGKVVLPYRRR
ncbi:hypothetical protein IAT38_004374 [Cryptococcus sp. DSM 104549]